MGERRGTKALELWCRRITDGYPGVNVQNMTTSWRDGLAFCAMIHHFRPDLIDFNSLNKDDVYGNNELAFRTAEQHLGIPALLDAEDMASCAVPDRLSILTYLSQFYQTFGGSSPSRLAMNRTTETSNERITRPVTETPKPKVVSRLGMRRDPCAVCGLPVFLAEKLVIDHMPYHRTCFRCARCSNQLTPGNYYETEDGQYCCETCPDEEPAPSSLHDSYDEEIAKEQRTSAIPTDDYVVSANRQRSLSDEEKTERQIFKNKDVYMKLQDTAVSDVTSQTAQMRLDFMANHLLSERSNESSATDGPTSIKPVKVNSDRHANRTVDSLVGQTASVDSAFPDGDEEDEDEDEDDDVNKDEDNEPTSSCANSVSASPIHEKSPASRTDHSTDELRKEDSVSNTLDSRLNSVQKSENERFISHHDASQESLDIKRFLVNQSSDTSTVQEKRNNVYNAQNINLVTRNDVEEDNQHVTAILPHDIRSDKGINDIDVVHKRDNTKDPSTQAEEHEDTSEGLSLVRKRLKMFENREKQKNVGKDNEVDKKDAGVLEATRVDPRERLTAGSGESNDKKPALKLESKIVGQRNEIQSPREDSVTSIESKLFAERKSASHRIDSMTTESSAQKEKKLPVSEILRTNQKKTFTDFDDSEVNETQVPRFSLDETSRNAVSSTESENIDLLSEDVSNVENKVEPVTDESASEMNLSTAKGIDLSINEDYPEDLNPFNEEDEEQDEDLNTKTTLNSSRGSQRSTVRTALDSSRSSKVSTNPFESDEDEEEVEMKNVVPPKPAIRTNVAGKNAQVPEAPAKRKLVAPHISLNPFWSDEEEERDSSTESNAKHTSTDIPVPKPRTIKNTPELGTAPRKMELNRGGFYASNSSITSSESTTTPGGTYRKKKPAPPPPVAKELFPTGQQTSPASKSLEKSSLNQQNTSPRTTPRTRKSKPAPPPPMPTSSPYSTTSAVASLTLTESPITDHSGVNDNQTVNLWEDQKTNKDEANRNRQSLTLPCEDNQPYSTYSDKSIQGKWKRKKGPAPPRPIPHRRKIKVMSMKDVKLELDEIELQQQGLEKQGVRLEQIIRDRCESAPQNDESSLSIDVEELVLELFALVNEKNELFRRQAELMLLKRQQRLEEEHAEVEYQIRCLMCRPEATKTDFDKQREESLIQRLVEIVERRNEIVECLEMDRRREVEEDRSIHTQMGLFAAKNKNETVSNNNDSNKTVKGKKGKVKEKGKEKKTKSLLKKDADKDVDETEVKLKHHNKRKWF